MKRFIWLLVLVAVGYAAWKHYPEIEQRARELTGDVMLASDQAETAPLTETSPVSKESSATRAASPAEQKTDPPNGASRSKAATPKEEADDPRFPFPTFKPLEEVVGNWKAIPRSAFPRQVTLKKDLDFTLVARGQGSARFNAGARVYALSAEADTLVLAPSSDSPMRAKAQIDDTDLKQVLATVYEQFKEKKRAEVRRHREEAVAGSKSLRASLATKQPPPAVLQRIGPQPPQQPDGKVPLMVASLTERRRQKKDAEPALEDITAWKGVSYREINGEPYWCGALTYTTRTIFGEFPTEAHALIRHGKVVQWLYADTNEPLP